ncbi:MAG: CBS domain-containing protein [Chloroflexota bacterium]|nr:CBS domain-containing protein [Chloroflexota bacterium]
MNENLIKDWMSSDPITVSSGVTLPEAYWLMIKNNIRRLPVIDNDVLVGIVTLDDLKRMEPVNFAGLDMIQMGDMLCKLPVRKVMTENPITVSSTETLVEAARLMLNHKISALPVVEGSRVVGIITESDIFRAFVAREEM